MVPHAKQFSKVDSPDFIQDRKTKSLAHVCEKYIKILPSEKVDRGRVITQQKQLAQSRRSAWSALYILNTLGYEPKGQEIKLECMNYA